MTVAPETPSVSRLLDWYDRHRRDLPWRAAPGETPDPYRVWLSEIMLQQTTVATAKPYFESFLAQWPLIQDLAAADADRVLHAWQGLGYYARARNLLKCARIVSQDLGGRLPESERELRKLPGIGPYTAAAIAAIAFGQKTVPVDGNVVRVLARLYAVGEALPGARRRIGELARGLAPSQRPGDFAQALMDLGSTVCTPRKPACAVCPASKDRSGSSAAGRVATSTATAPRRFASMTLWKIAPTPPHPGDSAAAPCGFSDALATGACKSSSGGVPRTRTTTAPSRSRRP